ncbi:MAG: LptF/LptG family permease [Bacteroidaceae bacterium]|nr:LptF/LptG family permease [Bacteroidaceae bacterium]
MFRIKKLDIYVIKKFLLLLAATFIICHFVFMMQFLWRWVDDLIGKGLGMVVMAKFFYYSGLTLIPMALPLAILLAALICFGNLGEQFELLSMKAAGISLFRIIRPLIVITTFVGCVSFYFQDVIVPQSWVRLYTLLYSMRQTSPELDIPEGSFYNGIQGYNLFVKKKEPETGMMRGVIIYNMADGFENAHIVLADSGKLVMTEDKKHLVLHLWSGEQFENLQTGGATGSLNAQVPYRRESFAYKQTIIPFDGGFEMADADFFNGMAKAKSMKKLLSSIDSINAYYDSISRSYYEQNKQVFLTTPFPGKKARKHEKVNVDTMFSKLDPQMRQQVLSIASSKIEAGKGQTEYQSSITLDGEKEIRNHWMEWHQKITVALACLIFLFIGAPLGAIIRKGGLGMPVVISVLIFIFYFIINNFGMRLAKTGAIPVWIGMWMSSIILAPIGAFLAYKSNNDSVVLNIDHYRNFFLRLFGVRQHRHVFKKEVIIDDPDYATLPERLDRIIERCRAYHDSQHIAHAPNYIKIFWRNTADVEVEEISEELEALVDELSNSTDKVILYELNKIPILGARAHTSPFARRWANATAGLILPVGIILFFRIWRFRLRLYRDMKQIANSSEVIKEQIKRL